MINEPETRLPSSEEMEEEMPVVRCPKCIEYNEDRVKRPRPQRPYHDPRIFIQVWRGALKDAELASEVRLEGILTCLDDGHRRPIKVENNAIDETAPSMPVAESAQLHKSVPAGLVQDLEEAERAHFAQCYKASVVMCRRAMQLALENRGASGRTLGPLLEDARKKTPPLLSVRADSLAEGIKDYGDGGAHRTEFISPPDAAMMIHVTVVAINELYP